MTADARTDVLSGGYMSYIIVHYRLYILLVYTVNILTTTIYYTTSPALSVLDYMRTTRALRACVHACLYGSAGAAAPGVILLCVDYFVYNK